MLEACLNLDRATMRSCEGDLASPDLLVARRGWMRG